LAALLPSPPPPPALCMGHMALAAEDSVPAAKGHIERDAEGETERRVLCRNSEQSVPYWIANVKSLKREPVRMWGKQKEIKKKMNVCLCSPEAWNSRKEKTLDGSAPFATACGLTNRV
jgi:hypothetical protein